MLNKSHLNSMNSLQIKSIREFVSKYQRQQYRHIGDTDAQTWHTINGLNIHLRQNIIDYIIEEKVKVSSKLIQSLITGGLISMDLWRLCHSNTFTTTEIMALLETIGQNSRTMESLSLGGSEWIYNNKVIRGPLKRIFDSRLQQMVCLRMQQIASAEDLLSVLKSCVQLKRLEICLPSITDRDINRIEERLKTLEVVEHLKELHLPSSLKCNSLMKLLAIFSHISTLKCSAFEQLLDLIDCTLSSSQNKKDLEMASKAKKTLSSMTSLIVTHPMSCDTIDRMVNTCPRLQNLCLELQSGMQLSAISRLQDLRHLEVRNCPSAPLDYRTQVLPILETKGRQLEILSLEHFDVIDLTSCAKLCPNLLRFSAQWFTTLDYIRPDMPSSLRDRQLKNPFSNLTHVRLRPRCQRNIPSEACAFILANAKRLTHIELYCCYDLSDGDVQALQTKNPMTHLRSLILRHGHKVTKEALNLLVSRAHGLSFIDCGIPLKKDEVVADH